MKSVTEVVCFNVKYLAKKKGIKIGDIESKLGKPIGYLARKVINKTQLTIDIVDEMAKMLGVSINDLCSDIKLKDIEEYVESCGYRLVPISGSNDNDNDNDDEETETWNGIHGQVTAPKGTFEKIWNEAKEGD